MFSFVTLEASGLFFLILKCEAAVAQDYETTEAHTWISEEAKYSCLSHHRISFGVEILPPPDTATRGTQDSYGSISDSCTRLFQYIQSIGPTMSMPAAGSQLEAIDPFNPVKLFSTPSFWKPW